MIKEKNNLKNMKTENFLKETKITFHFLYSQNDSFVTSDTIANIGGYTPLKLNVFQGQKSIHISAVNCKTQLGNTWQSNICCNTQK